MFFLLTSTAICGWRFYELAVSPPSWHDKVYYPLVSNIDCFVIGIFSAVIVRKFRERAFYLKNGFALSVFFVLCCQVFYSVWSFPEMTAYAGYPGSDTRIYYLSFAPMVVSTLTGFSIILFEVSERKSIRFTFGWKLSSLVGSLTYCIYVVHEPIYLSLRKIISGDVSIYQSLFIFPFGFFIVYLFALFLYKFVELRFDSMKSAPRS